MATPRNRLKGAGASYLGVGVAFVAFLAIAASGQAAFLGVGVVFLVLGIAALAKARKDGQP